ncbi:MAG TPA: hypothetical protein VKB69_06375, partial [Micromonosporaceae bacterium]|nr:hypothetical protein [Micromonosporaceae bacterium]
TAVAGTAVLAAVATAAGTAVLADTGGSGAPVTPHATRTATATPTRSATPETTAPKLPAGVEVPTSELTGAPAQRLNLWQPDSGWGRPSPAYGVTGVVAPAEVSPAGTISHPPINGVNPDNIDETVDLPGGLLAAYVHQLVGQPPPGTPDGPTNPYVVGKVLIVNPDGSVVTSAVIPTLGQEVSMVGASTTVAYLLRPGGIFSHDLASGTEHLIVSARAMGLVPDSVIYVDIGGGRLAAADAKLAGHCLVRIFDVTSGTAMATISLDPLGCDRVDGSDGSTVGHPRLSPDGRRVAVEYGTKDGSGVVSHLAVFDADDGTLIADRRLGVLVQRDAFFAQVWGIAWYDPTTVMIAWTALPAEPTRDYGLADVLEVLALKVS